VKSLGLIGDPAAIGPLRLVMQNDAEAQVRLKAVQALRSLTSGAAGSSKARTQAALQRILDALPGRDWQLTPAIESALDEIRNTGALSSVTDGLRSPDSAVRERIAWVLGQLGHPDAVGALIRALDDPDAHVRHNAAWSLGTLRQPAAVPSLLTHAANEPQADAKAGMIWALGSIGGPETTGALNQALRDPSDDVRKAAEWGLARQR
jgi:HEAT repeat protein